MRLFCGRQFQGASVNLWLSPGSCRIYCAVTPGVTRLDFTFAKNDKNEGEGTRDKRSAAINFSASLTPSQKRVLVPSQSWVRWDIFKQIILLCLYRRYVELSTIILDIGSLRNMWCTSEMHRHILHMEYCVQLKRIQWGSTALVLRVQRTAYMNGLYKAIPYPVRQHPVDQIC